MNYWTLPGMGKKGKSYTDNEMKDYVLGAIEHVTGYNYTKLKSKSRKHEIVLARFVCYKLLRQYTKLSLLQIGNTFNRDHTTIMHGLRALQDMLDTKDKEAMKLYTKTRNLIYLKL